MVPNNSGGFCDQYALSNTIDGIPEAWRRFELESRRTLVFAKRFAKLRYSSNWLWLWLWILLSLFFFLTSTNLNSSLDHCHSIRWQVLFLQKGLLLHQVCRRAVCVASMPLQNICIRCLLSHRWWSPNNYGSLQVNNAARATSLNAPTLQLVLVSGVVR